MMQYLLVRNLAHSINGLDDSFDKLRHANFSKLYRFIYTDASQLMAIKINLSRIFNNAQHN